MKRKWTPSSAKALANREKLSAIARRIRQGMTHADIAREFGVSRQYVSLVGVATGNERGRGWRKAVRS